MNIKINQLIKSFQDVQSGKNWIGTNFDQKLAPLNDKAFFYKIDEKHSVAQIIAHLTTWRKETLIKIVSGEGTITDDHESNWIKNNMLIQRGKSDILKEFDSSLKELIELLKSKEDHFLDESYFDTDFNGSYPYSFVLYGMLHHDLYHLGQIALLTKLLPIVPEDDPYKS